MAGNGNSKATRERLIAAATDEFATYGIAGARVERIALTARSNKAQIYHYFGSKEKLFDEVLRTVVANRRRDLPIDVTDLPGYGARLFDSYEQDPTIARIARWHRLEHDALGDLFDPVIESLQEKVAAISAAQDKGELPRHFDAGTILGLVIHLANLWSVTTPEFRSALGSPTRYRRRQVVIDSITMLLQDPDEFESEAAAGPLMARGSRR